MLFLVVSLGIEHIALLSSVAPAGMAWLPALAAGGETLLWLGIGAAAATAVSLALAGGKNRSRKSTTEKDERLSMIIEHTEALLWEASVEKTNGTLEWGFTLLPSALARRLFGENGTGKRLRLWRHHEVPQMAEMNERSLAALTNGDSGYQQEYQHITERQSTWIRESVSITREGPDKWWVVGLATDITAQRRAEADRISSEHSLTEILDRADCLLWRSRVRKDPDGWTWSKFDVPKSRLYPRLFGDRELGADGQMWSMIEAPELDKMNNRYREAIANGDTGYDQEFRVVNPTGQKFWLHEQVTIQPIDKDEWFFVGVITDITARREAEQAVRGSELRYRSLFEHVPVAIVEADFSKVGDWLDRLRADGVEDLEAYFKENPEDVSRTAMRVRLVNSNETARNLFSAKDSRDLRWRRELIATSESLAVIKDTFLAIWHGDNRLEAEVSVRDLTGALHHTNLRWWVAKTEEGFDLRQSVMVFVDLTDLKRIEEDLAHETERLAVMLRAMTEGVVTTDTNGQVAYMNAAAGELIGTTSEAALGRPVEEVFRISDPDSRQEIPLPVREVARGDRISDLPGQVALQMAGGNERLVAGRFAPIHTSDSRVIGVVLVFRDVTDQVRLENEMVRSTRLESVGLLAGGIAHDFNNILTTIMGNLSLVVLDTEESSEAGRSARAAERATVRARDLTQQLLTFAKGGEPVREAVRLEDVIREMAEFALHGSNVKCHYQLPPNLWLADVDRGQIGRVIQNLVINAIQAMPDGGEVRIRARNEVLSKNRPGLRQGGYVYLEIEDQGSGIQVEDLNRIFDPYFSTKKTGSGLGLSAAYSIIRKHGGYIDAKSEPKTGSTFRIWLPASPESEEKTQVLDIDSEVMLKGRILFMDDEESIREMAASLLKRLGMHVTLAVDGAEVVTQYREAMERGETFDLVITDLTVPGAMGGKEAVQQLQAIDSNVKVIVSSGYSSDPILADFKSHGFFDMVAKPYELADLKRVLKSALNLDTDA